jgi:nucleoside 2-deoxyribosyltransferase
MIPRLYLAGPTVFHANAREAGRKLKEICALHGCEGLYPLDPELVLPADGKQAARMIYESCLSLLARADAVVADLGPWRGPHCDDGTAFELGYATARRLPIVGYAHDLSPLVERIDWEHTQEGEKRDRNGHLVEDFGLPFNLMIAGALSGLYPSAEEAIAAAAALVACQPRPR